MGVEKYFLYYYTADNIETPFLLSLKHRYRNVVTIIIINILQYRNVFSIYFTIGIETVFLYYHTTGIKTLETIQATVYY